MASIISFLIRFIMVTVAVTNRPCHTITNLVMCNTAVFTMIFCIFQLISSVYGIREDWFSNQPACIFRTYCYVGICIAVPTSYAVQSISRLFFCVLYTYKNFLTWHTHYYMIIINYLMGILGPIIPMQFRNAYGLEIESRLCLTTTKNFYSSMLGISIAYLFPLLIIIIIYGIIFYHTWRSTRRITTFESTGITDVVRNNSINPNLKRELILMRNIFILINILVFAGLSYLILVIWHATQKQLPPEPLYLLVQIAITISFKIKMIIMFWMNKDVKNITVQYIRNLR